MWVTQLAARRLAEEAPGLEEPEVGTGEAVVEVNGGENVVVEERTSEGNSAGSSTSWGTGSDTSADSLFVKKVTKSAGRKWTTAAKSSAALSIKRNPAVKRKHSEEDYYEVEAIVDKRVAVISGDVDYLVKWKDWSPKYNTWEPYRNVSDCVALSEFEDKLINQERVQENLTVEADAVDNQQELLQENLTVEADAVNTKQEEQQNQENLQDEDQHLHEVPTQAPEDATTSKNGFRTLADLSIYAFSRVFLTVLITFILFIVFMWAIN